MADDHCGPVYAPRNPADGANQGLGLVLGTKIRQIQPFGFTEQPFREPAAVAARDRDGAEKVETGRRDLVRQVERMASSEHVGAHEICVRGIQVVQGAEMEEMVDAAGHGTLLGGRYAEERLS